MSTSPVTQIMTASAFTCLVYFHAASEYPGTSPGSWLWWDHSQCLAKPQATPALMVPA
jgi:hypothetical protein